MTSEHPLVARYIERLTAALSNLTPADRTEVVKEIADHISDAAAAGKPIDDILKALGSADDLARGYEVELLLHPKKPAASRIDRYVRLIALVALGSIPTFVVVVTLGTVGLSLALSGVLVFVAGLMDSFGTLPYWMHSDVEPWIPVALGPILTVIGIVAIWLLVLYIRFTVRMVKRALPSKQ